MNNKSFLAALLMGCLAASYAAAENTTIQTHTSNNAQFEQVNSEQHKGNTRVSGKLTRTRYNSSVAPGHIDYQLVNAQGKILTQGIADYTPALSLRHWKHGSDFEFTLPGQLPAQSVIKLAYHQGNHQSPHLGS